jgi:hypothetical protein
MGNLRAFQTLKYSTYIDEFTNLLPPMWTANKPTKKWWVYLGAVSTKQDEVLAKSAFETSRNVSGFTRITAPRQNNIVLLGLGLPCPLNVILGRNSSGILRFNSSFFKLGNCNIRITGFYSRRRSVVTID